MHLSLKGSLDRQPLTDRLGDRLLAEYGGAAAAYSLRALNGNGDNVVRVRRASDNSEQDFTALQVADGTLTTFCGVGDGFVETWYDQSGNGNDATQATIASQPKIVDAGSLVENDEGNAAIQGATGKFFDVSAVTGIEDFSIFFVGQAPDDFRSLLGMPTDTDILRLSNLYWELVANLFDPGNMTFSPELTAGNTTLFNFTRSSGTVQGFANSAISSSTTSNPNTNNFNFNRIFRRASASFNDYNKKASELIIYTSDESSNRTAIEANINDHYSIY